jgi:glycosyltransferase involved in cell wall biosynthesis
MVKPCANAGTCDNGVLTPCSPFLGQGFPLVDILQVLYYYTPHCSGVTIYAERLARHLTARGHRVTILASRHDTSFPREQAIDGVRIVRVPSIYAVSRGVVMPGFLPAAAKLIRQHDVVHMHLPVLEAAGIAALSRAMRKRLVLTHHTDLTLNTGRFNHAAASAVFASGIAAGKLADTVVTYTHDRAQVSPTVTRLKRNATVIYPPVEIDPPSEDGIAAFREKHNLGRGPVIGFAGRFAEEKGCDDLLRTIPKVRECCPGATYAFAGEYRKVVGETFYERTKPLLDQHSEHVRMLGVLRGQELSDFYAACDVLVLPSVNFTETFGLVQVEAMLCGTPVIASDLPGVREPIRVTGMGRITPPREPDQLAEAIIDVISNRPSYVRPRDEIAATFQIDATIDAYERVYRGEPVA